MSVPPLDVSGRTFFTLDEGIRWWDADTGCTLVVSRPLAEPSLWAEYVEGAQRNYRRHGVEQALDMAEIGKAEETALFYAAVDETGRVVGGVRARGPYRSADESHAMVEWAGQPGLQTVRKMITDRLPFGVVEMKTAWVTDDAVRKRGLAKTLARSAFPTMALLDVQFLMATMGNHVIELWRSSGGVVASRIPPTPYPDERYRTKMMWWDRRTFVNHAEPKQLSKMLTEIAELNEVLNHREGVLERSGSSV